MAKRKPYHVGDTFGNITITAIPDEPFRIRNKVVGRCLLCGVEKTVCIDDIRRSRRIDSCGCRNVKHGYARPGRKHPTYVRWISMMDRCHNPKTKRYADWGGRGIKVCERWQTFENFLEDMGLPPDGMTLDRVDNDLGYSMDNCRWASPKDQSRNRRDNHLITFRGETKCLMEWSITLGYKYSTLCTRLSRGMSVERAFTKSTRDHSRLLDGKKSTHESDL